MFIGFPGQHQDVADALGVNELHFFAVLRGFKFYALYLVLAMKAAIGAMARAEIR